MQVHIFGDFRVSRDLSSLASHCKTLCARQVHWATHGHQHSVSHWEGLSSLRRTCRRDDLVPGGLFRETRKSAKGKRSFRMNRCTKLREPYSVLTLGIPKISIWSGLILHFLFSRGKDSQKSETLHLGWTPTSSTFDLCNTLKGFFSPFPGPKYLWIRFEKQDIFTCQVSQDFSPLPRSLPSLLFKGKICSRWVSKRKPIWQASMIFSWS